MENFLKNWTILRITHLSISVIFIGAAVYFSNNVFLYILGIGFLVQSLTNTGCSNNSCSRDEIRAKYRRRH
ncbi:hypothetical protein EGI22_19585 [Lacihabitans sp. LS3-19]|uniref:hypothetical protein n=1 Tax=Lacihabitans sp. LS3-19 TaxID=2487335 RepID=UPI0020CE3BB9|nr:hypothetical protein [Lacihabitans sp. LS3-19]MCP9770112.1 hypothetical protein [Lacihabitans sp. LS3-19]